MLTLNKITKWMNNHKAMSEMFTTINGVMFSVSMWTMIHSPYPFSGITTDAGVAVSATGLMIAYHAKGMQNEKNT